MARIMNAGDVHSKIFRPRIKFGISLRAAQGEITGNWFLYHSADKTHWVKSHKTSFNEDDPTAIFDIPQGLYCQLRSPDSAPQANLVVDIGYIYSANPTEISIEPDIED